MDFYTEMGAGLLSAADDLIGWSGQLLQKAPLNATQRSDLRAINQAAKEFSSSVQTRLPQISPDAHPDELQRVRHDLLNNLNIVVGFSQILVREMPDNLLLHMLTIRQIFTRGKDLMEQVRTIR